MVIKPFAIFSILYFIWNYVFKSNQNSSLFLLSGIILSEYISDGVTLGLHALENKAHIILKINFPREVVIFSSTGVALINFLVNFSILISFILLNEGVPSLPGFMLALFAIVTLYVVILGISLFTSIWNILMKDLHHLVELTLRMLFWATPFIYDIDALPPKVAKWINLNPITHILEAFRAGLLDNPDQLTDPFRNLLLVFVIALVLTAIGYFYFKFTVKKIAEHF
jgi:ABC-type polysaccharide/polyol phosphate export permease